MSLRAREAASEARNPPGDFGTENLVLRSETGAEGGLFVYQHKGVKQQLDDPAVFQHCHVSENQALTQNDRDH
jgi:hypothetical protein